MRAPASIALTISTRWRSAMEDSSMRLFGIDIEPQLRSLFSDLPFNLAHAEDEAAAPIGQQYVLNNGEQPRELEFLMYHADATGGSSRRPVSSTSLPLTKICPASGV